MVNFELRRTRTTSVVVSDSRKPANESLVES